MDKQPRHSERVSRPRERPPDPPARRDRSGRGAATALERLKQLEREAQWLRQPDDDKPDKPEQG